MAICIDPGYGTTNGVCAILTQINTHGIVLFDCDDLEYIPAICPDNPAEGAISLGGAATVKIASVDGASVNLCVQRDADGQANSQSFVAVSDGSPRCSLDVEGSRVTYQWAAIGPAIGGVADYLGYQSVLRLRGNGDLDIFDGDDAVGDVYGVARVARVGGRDGDFDFVNSCSLLASAADHHFWNQERPTNLAQDLMKLSPTAGTLYFPAWTYVSEDKLKKNNHPLPKHESTTKVKGMVPQSYEYEPDGETYQGFTYSNLLTTCPEVTTTIKRLVRIDGTGEEGHKVEETIGAIRVNDIVAILTASLQDVIDRVEALETPGNGNPNGN